GGGGGVTVFAPGSGRVGKAGAELQPRAPGGAGSRTESSGRTGPQHKPSPWAGSVRPPADTHPMAGPEPPESAAERLRARDPSPRHRLPQLHKSQRISAAPSTGDREGGGNDRGRSGRIQGGREEGE
ncbi:hypothetical protein chiPu_0024619, partial [Chiloscyllium punctatum]|nr:hypothetical protein [Chiloscyllium punctatum]